jgi:dihydrofolate reductase
MINIIAAVGKNLELGKDNKLIWNIPNDLKYFKEKTQNKTVVMGRKTYESIGKPLKNRKNIVLTRQNINIDNVETVNNYQELLKTNEDVFIIGGEQIYKMFLPYADNIYLTEINDSKDADSYFPEFNKDLYEKEIIKEEKYNDLEYKFVVYRKK